MLDAMVALARGGCDIVCASRFMPGGAMVGCPPLKAALVRTANFTLRHLARLPTTDASNGFRMFSRRVIERIAVESDQGFCYSIELLVKAHRLGWTIGEVPVRWFERQHGASRFRVLKWLPAYLRWYGYAFATTFLRRPPDTVALKETRHMRPGSAMKWPRIRSRRTTAVSPWMSIIAREVEFSRGETPQIYHAVEQADYISIVALTRGGKIPIVRQYRPALEAFSWELPAGLVDPGESPADACRRELLEETGLTARAIHPLGENSPCTGRLDNRIHSFFVEAGEPRQRLRAGAGHHREAGVAGRGRPPDHDRRLRLPAPPRRAAARRAPRLSGSAAQRARSDGRRRPRPRTRGASIGKPTGLRDAIACSRDHRARSGRDRAPARGWRDAWRRAG